MNLLITTDQVRLENIGIRDLGKPRGQKVKIVALQWVIYHYQVIASSTELSESGELEPLELEIDTQSVRSLEVCGTGIVADKVVIFLTSLQLSWKQCLLVCA